MVFVCVESNIIFSLKHLPGSTNRLADLLSRLQVDQFLAICPGASNIIKHPFLNQFGRSLPRNKPHLHHSLATSTRSTYSSGSFCGCVGSPSGVLSYYQSLFTWSPISQSSIWSSSPLYYYAPFILRSSWYSSSTGKFTSSTSLPTHYNSTFMHNLRIFGWLRILLSR